MNMMDKNDTFVSSGSAVSYGSSPSGERTFSGRDAPVRSGDPMDFSDDLSLSEPQAARLDTLAELMNYTCHFVHHYSGKRGQGRILSLLARESAMTQHEMQNRLNIQSGSLSEILTKLENAGFITRQRDASDRRRQIIAITEAGQADLDEHRARRLHQQRSLYSDLSDAEQEELIRILRKLHESWQKFPPQGQSDGCRCQKAAETGNGQSLSNPGANQSSENPGHLQSPQDTDSGQNPADTDDAQNLPNTGNGQVLTDTDKSPRLPSADSDRESPVIGQAQRSPNADNHEHTEAQRV